MLFFRKINLTTQGNLHDVVFLARLFTHNFPDRIQWRKTDTMDLRNNIILLFILFYFSLEIF